MVAGGGFLAGGDDGALDLGEDILLLPGDGVEEGGGLGGGEGPGLDGLGLGQGGLDAQLAFVGGFVGGVQDEDLLFSKAPWRLPSSRALMASPSRRVFWTTGSLSWATREPATRATARAAQASRVRVRVFIRFERLESYFLMGGFSGEAGFVSTGRPRTSVKVFLGFLGSGAKVLSTVTVLEAKSMPLTTNWAPW